MGFACLLRYSKGFWKIWEFVCWRWTSPTSRSEGSTGLWPMPGKGQYSYSYLRGFTAYLKKGDFRIQQAIWQTCVMCLLEYGQEFAGQIKNQCLNLKDEIIHLPQIGRANCSTCQTLCSWCCLFAFLSAWPSVCLIRTIVERSSLDSFLSSFCPPNLQIPPALAATWTKNISTSWI